MKKSRSAFPILSAAVLILLFFLSFLIGRFPVSAPDVGKILLSKLFPIKASWTSQMESAVLHLRLPRILLSMIVGCALSVSGVCFQCVFRNPMASGDILGASSGACFGAALALLLGLSHYFVTASAFGFGLLSILLVFRIGRHTHGSPTVSILLAGIIIGSLFSAGTSYLKLIADPNDTLPAITYWMMGSLSGKKLSDLVFPICVILPCLVLIFLLRWRINLLTLSDEEARSMGVRTGRLRALLIALATIMTASCVAVSGLIGWIGLVIPNLCRKAAGSDHRALIPSSMLVGAAFLLLIDDLSRILFASEIPIGILTAFIGAPFFLYLLTRKEHTL